MDRVILWRKSRQVERCEPIRRNSDRGRDPELLPLKFDGSGNALLNPRGDTQGVAFIAEFLQQHGKHYRRGLLNLGYVERQF